MPINKMICKSPLHGWINVVLGYEADGMYGEFENESSFNGAASPETKRYRQCLFSLDIGWTKIKTYSGLLKVVFIRNDILIICKLKTKRH